MRIRRWLVAAAVCLLALAACYAYARWVEPNRITVEHVTAVVPGLPAELEDLRVVFLSDLQIESAGLRERRLGDRLRALSPDVILIGGDFANVPYWLIEYEKRAAVACSVIATFPARYGIYAVWGNNDLPQSIADDARAAGIRVLENEWTTLDLPGGKLTLLGLDDPVTNRASFDRAFSPRPPDPFIMIAHSPDAFPEACARDVPLLLAGHTHGGQVLTPLTVLMPRRFLRLKDETPTYRAGRFEEGGSVLYVSRGIGTSYVNLRFLCPPEVTVVHLRVARERAHGG